jgi:4-hydroxy-tetrahydrodipicolinate synthase
MVNKYRGVYAVPCTPFDSQGKVDDLATKGHIRYLIDECNVHGIIPVGSTGEFASLTKDERNHIVSITLDEVNKQVPVYAGAAACSTDETIAYARAAQSLGVDGVMVVPPYYGHLSQDELYFHYSTLAQSVDCPIIVYNNPGTSGSDILPSLVERLTEYKNIEAIKESSGFIQRVSEIMRRCGGNIEVICGCDTLAMEMFALGVEGWIAAPANIIGKQCVELYELMVVKKDFEKAKQLYFKILPIMELFEDTGKYVQLAKAGLEIMGRGIGEPRKPLLPAESELISQLKDSLSGLVGVLDHTNRHEDYL